MRIRVAGMSGQDLCAAVNSAIDRLNRVDHYTNGIMLRTETIRPRVYDFTIRMSDSVRPGTQVRKSTAIIEHAESGTVITGPSRRRSIYACWHTHRDLLAALYSRLPLMVATSGDARYEDRTDFYETFPATGNHNIGSVAQPLRRIDACDCGLRFDAYAPGVESAICDGWVPFPG